ncbi:MAG: hypothetical protein ABIH46_03440 [Chloroflexota bacterium]
MSRCYRDTFPGAQQVRPFRRPKHSKTLPELAAELEMLKAKRAVEISPVGQLAIDIAIENCEQAMAEQKEDV